MTDNELENIHTVDVKVTAESMDAHVQCLRDNGYSVTKKITFTIVVNRTISFSRINH